jgi:hypothetical protein
MTRNVLAAVGGLATVVAVAASAALPVLASSGPKIAAIPGRVDFER